MPDAAQDQPVENQMRFTRRGFIKTASSTSLALAAGAFAAQAPAVAQSRELHILDRNAELNYGI